MNGTPEPTPGGEVTGKEKVALALAALAGLAPFGLLIFGLVVLAVLAEKRKPIASNAKVSPPPPPTTLEPAIADASPDATAQ